MLSTREALEAALVARPNDVATHMAYADLLIEEGDPRGEFIRLQLALEDETLTRPQRVAFKQAALLLWNEHKTTWIGSLNDTEIRSRPGLYQRPSVAFNWKRGWIDVLYVQRLTPDNAISIQQSSILRLIRTCRIEECSADIQPIEHLQPMFASLVRTTLKSLTVSFGPGDDLVDMLATTGLLPRLEFLSLWRCKITDDGAVQLAHHLRPSQMKKLILLRNLITPIGAAALAEAGFPEIGPQDWDEPGARPAYV